MWELDDVEVKEKIVAFASNPEVVTWSGTADREIGSVPGATRLAVLEGILDHLACGYIVHGDFMKNGDLAYIFECFAAERFFYVKVKFVGVGTEERMRIFSAHLNR